MGRLDEALRAARRATALAPADPLCLHNQAVIHYHRLELDAALDCAGRALRIDPSLPGAHFVRAEALLLRGEWAEGWEEYEWRFRIAGAAPLMPPTSKPQWDGGALSRRHAAADRRPGLWRRDPVRALHPVGGANAAPTSRSPAAPRCGHCCGRSRRRAAVRSLGGRAGLSRRSVALSGLPRLAGTRIDNVPAPIPVSARRPGPRRAMGRAAGRLGAARLPPRRRHLGRPADAQQRPQPLGAAGGFPAAGECARRCAAGVAEGTEDRPGRRVLWPRAADQHRRRDRGLRRHDGDPRQPRSAGDGRYLGRASGRRHGAAGVDHAAARTGLALAARSRGYAVVSDRAAVPSDESAPMGRCRGGDRGRTGSTQLE